MRTVSLFIICVLAILSVAHSTFAQQRKFLNVGPSGETPNENRPAERPLVLPAEIDDHPANAEQRKHGSFHRPNRSMNHHANTIRRHGRDLHGSAVCLLADQMANGLSTICFYNCNGHQYSMAVDSMTDCAQTVSESTFGN